MKMHLRMIRFLYLIDNFIYFLTWIRYKGLCWSSMFACFDYCDSYSLNSHLRRKSVLSHWGCKEVQQFVFTQEITVLRNGIKYEEL